MSEEVRITDMPEETNPPADGFIEYSAPVSGGYESRKVKFENFNRLDFPVTLTYTDHALTAYDMGKTLYFTNDDPVTLTIFTNSNTPLPINSVVAVVQEGEGQVTIQGDNGVEVNGVVGGSEKIVGRYMVCQLVKRDTDRWLIFGGLE